MNKKGLVLSIIDFVLFLVFMIYATYEEPLQDIQNPLWKAVFKYGRDLVVALVPAYVTYLVYQGYEEINNK